MLLLILSKMLHMKQAVLKFWLVFSQKLPHKVSTILSHQWTGDLFITLQFPCF